MGTEFAAFVRGTRTMVLVLGTELFCMDRSLLRSMEAERWDRMWDMYPSRLWMVSLSSSEFWTRSGNDECVDVDGDSIF